MIGFVKGFSIESLSIEPDRLPACLIKACSRMLSSGETLPSILLFVVID